jgi:hypothetical protein
MSVPAIAVRAADTDGADHPLLPRFGQAEIENYRGSSLRQILLPTLPVSNDARAKGLLVEGDVTDIDYKIAPSVSSLSVMRHYQDLLAQKGFTVLLDCAGDRCGGEMSSLICNSGKTAPTGFHCVFNDTVEVIVARNKDTFVIVHVAADRESTAVYEGVVEHGKIIGA